MLFRNVRLYRFDADAEVPSAEMLDAALAEHAFAPCSRLQAESMGFVPPAGDGGIVLTAGDLMLLRLRRQQKVLPAGAVNERLEESERAFEARTGRRPRPKERRDLKDELRSRLLPGALTRSSYAGLYIDPAERIVAVDAAAAAAAERVLEHLRSVLGGLAVVPLAFERGPSALFARVLLGEQIDGLVLGEHCVLRDPLQDSSEVRYRNADLDDPQLRAQVRAGMVPNALEMIWRDRVRFVMHADAAFTRLRSLEFDAPAADGDDFGEDDSESLASDGGDEEARMAADCLLLHMTLRGLLDDLSRVLV